MLVADLLCGAGGSSEGCKQALLALGLDMELVCLNHWPTAIETHLRMHPTARHYCQDIATVRPHLIVPEGYLDLLMASPTCTHHSNARGGKPTSDQQRSDPWHIVTWLTELRVKRAIIENVWEFINWGPVNAQTGRPVQSRRGEYFHAWIQTIRALGFEPEWRKLNAADFGDATTRVRFILMMRSDGRKVLWPMPTNRKITDLDRDLFSAEKPWRPAREIIDWSIRGKSIFGRQKPLAPKTLLRIFVGAVKFHWPQPYLELLMPEIERSLCHYIGRYFEVRNAKQKKKEREQRRAVVRKHVDMLRRFRSSPAEFTGGRALPEPLIVTLRRNADGRSIEGPIPTISAQGSHIGIAEPVVVNMKKGTAPATPAEPLPTQTSAASHIGMAEPVVVNMKGQSKASSVDQPLPTQTAGAGHLYQAVPIVLSQHSSGAPRSTDEPLPTITTGGAGSDERPGCARPMIVEPFVLSQASGGAPRPVSEPIPTQTTGGNGAAHTLISPYYGSGSGDTCTSAEEPLPTVTSKGRFGMVVPVTNSNGGAQARDINTDPMPTMTTAKGGEFAAVIPVTHAGGETRVGTVDEPLPTVTGANRGELAVAESGHGYDILFRMFEPHELSAAMGLEGYDFAGTKTEKIKQIGNAVSRRKMQACVTALMADAAPKQGRKSPSEFREAAE